VTATAGPDLARVTVSTPTRRMDVALPENAIVAELLPHLLRHAGDDLADDGEQHGGWTLRRATGAALDPTRSLGAQGVRDGELLNLAPRRADWPELAYDDIVEVIASGARRSGRLWSGAATRTCGLTVAAVLLAVGLLDVLWSGPSWTIPAVCAAALAVVLIAVGVVLSRSLSDAVAGGVVAGCALPYAFAAGLLATAPSGAELTDIGAPGLLLGCASLIVAGAIGYVAVAATLRIFVAGIGTGVAGLIGAVLVMLGVTAAGSAGIVLTLAIGLLPAYPLMARGLGGLPMPALPMKPEEILEDRPLPPRDSVFAAVARATELLSGMLTATAVVSICAMATLAAAGGTSARILIATAGAALLLRSRLFPIPPQRIPLILSGMLALVVLVIAMIGAADNAATRLLFLLVIAAVAGATIAGALAYSRRAASPRMGRTADIADVLAIMALVPLACAVAGVFHAIQGLFASVGG